MKSIEEKIKELPADLLPEVEEYIEALMAKRIHSKRVKPTFNWAGALKNMRNEYTSVELQHRASGWRAEDN